MIHLVLLLTFFTGLSNQQNPIFIKKQNNLISEAVEYQSNSEFKKAIVNYHILIDSMKINDSKLILNLAHCYFRDKKYTNSTTIYQKLILSNNKGVASIAYNQLGVISSVINKEREKALEHFKNALRVNPYNNQARYNFELLSKKTDVDNFKEPEIPKKEDQKKKEDKKENKDKKGDKEKDDKDKPGDKKDGKEGENKDKKGEEDQKGDKGKDNKDKPGDKKDGKEGEDKDKKGEEDQKGDKGKDNKDKPGDKKDGKEGEDKDKKGEEDQKGDKGKDNKDKLGDKKDGKEPGTNDENGEKKPDPKKFKNQANGGSLNGKKMKDQMKSQPDPTILGKMNMTPQQANALLNTMKNSETQYLQQLKKTPKKGSNKSANDW